MVVLRVWSLEQQGFLGACQKCTFLGSTFLYQKCWGWGPGDSDAHSGLRTAGVREGLPERVYQDGLMKDEEEFAAFQAESLAPTRVLTSL